MTNPNPRPTPERRGPALKLWTGHLAARGDLAEALRVGGGVAVAVYVLAPTKLIAIDLIEDRFGFEGPSDRDIEAAMVGGGPEVAQAMARDAAALMVEGRVYAVHGTAVVEVADSTTIRTAGRYHHERRRFVPVTAADRLVEAIETAEAVLRRGRGMTEDEEEALRDVIAAALERQMQIRESERDQGQASVFDACLDDAKP